MGNASTRTGRALAVDGKLHLPVRNRPESIAEYRKAQETRALGEDAACNKRGKGDDRISR